VKLLVCKIFKHLVNPSNAELNPICYLLALLGAHHILHVSRIRVNARNVEHICLNVIRLQSRCAVSHCYPTRNQIQSTQNYWQTKKNWRYFRLPRRSRW